MGCFLTLAIWGMRLYKRNVRLYEVSFFWLQTVSEHENPETDIDTFCTWIHWRAWILSCQKLSFRWCFFFFFFNKYCHSFVRICSFTCLNVVIVILWDTKGKAPASYQCLCALELLGIMARMWTTFKSLDCVHLKCESEMSLSVNCSFN